ncbi:TetR family transcriptional regulator [Granulosicoccaceae sp. 1_MG-2023]|nr:TetR family transcriptional regulator [Granulosicoccaceae sp. 1_MG-2023]
MSRKTKEEAAQTYNALLDSATLLFTRRGVMQTTLQDIARQANLTRGAVYWHFKDKDDLIRALWERDASHNHRNLIERIESYLERGEAPPLRTILTRALEEFLSTPHACQALRVVFNHDFCTGKTDLHAFFVQRERLILDVFERSFEAMSARGELLVPDEPVLLARGLFAYMRGLLDSYVLRDECHVDLQQYGARLISLWLDGVARKES